MTHAVGTLVRIVGIKEGTLGVPDISFNKDYQIAGAAFDGEEYFIDDAGDRNYACCSNNTGNAIYVVVDANAELEAAVKRANRLERAISTVCEGWTLPDDARKILESALWDNS